MTSWTLTFCCLLILTAVILNVQAETLEECSMPAKRGKCRARVKRYYFDKPFRSCRVFYYGGCDANANNFDTLDDCRRACGQYAEEDLSM